MVENGVIKWGKKNPYNQLGRAQFHQFWQKCIQQLKPETTVKTFKAFDLAMPIGFPMQLTFPSVRKKSTTLKAKSRYNRKP